MKKTGLSCPVCKGTRFAYFSYGNHTNGFSRQLIKHHLLQLAQPVLVHPRWQEKIKCKTLFSPLNKVAQCRDCGHGFYDRNIVAQDLEHYYQHAYYEARTGLDYDPSAETNTHLTDERALGQYNFIKPYLPLLPSINALEIGAGAARTLRLLRHHYPDKTQLHVIEPGKQWHAYYKWHDITVAADFFPFATDRQYNYIHLSHWLEHVLDLPSTITELKKITADQGLVFVEVPNCDEEYYKTDFKDEPHIHFFTQQSLASTFTQDGFELIKILSSGMTKQEWRQRQQNPGSFDPRLSENASTCSINNVPRQNGNFLRALFRKKA